MEKAEEGEEEEAGAASAPTERGETWSTPTLTSAAVASRLALLGACAQAPFGSAASAVQAPAPSVRRASSLLVLRT